MNILPLVFSLLLIFSCLCFSFLREVKSVTLIEASLEGYYHTEKAIQNALTKRAFQKIKEDPLPGGAPKEKRKKQERKFSSSRQQHPPPEASKFYLRAFVKWQTDISKHPLYEPLAQLLRSLYQERVFDKYAQQKGVEYQLIKALVEKAAKLPSVKQLYYLTPESPELQKIYYKLLRGTNRYTEQAGIAPLEHFLSLEPSDKALYIHSASIPLLQALFGPEMTRAILQEEERKQAKLTKEDVESIFLSHPEEAPLLTSLQPYLNFSKAPVLKKSVARRDTLTGIGMEKKI